MLILIRDKKHNMEIFSMAAGFKDELILILIITNSCTFVALLSLWYYHCRSQNKEYKDGRKSSYKEFHPSEIKFNEVVKKAQELEKSFDRESPDWPIRSQDLYEIRHNDVRIGTLRRNSLYSVSRSELYTDGSNKQPVRLISTSPSTVNTYLTQPSLVTSSNGVTSSQMTSPSPQISFKCSQDGRDESVFNESFESESSIQYDEIRKTPFTQLPKRNTFRAGKKPKLVVTQEFTPK